MTEVTPAGASRPLTVAPRRRGPVLVAWLAALVLVVAVVLWAATHPGGLPVSDRSVSASTTTGKPVYVGVFAAPADFGRSIRISGVRVFATSTAPVTITPRLCRGGSVGVTTTPDTFCTALVDTEGSTLRAGDEVVLEVRGDQPGAVSIDRIRIAYRDGWRWATQAAGSRSQVTIG